MQVAAEKRTMSLGPLITWAFFNEINYLPRAQTLSLLPFRREDSHFIKVLRRYATTTQFLLSFHTTTIRERGALHSTKYARETDLQPITEAA